LRHTLQAISEYAATEKLPGKFIEDVRTLIDRLLKALQNQFSIAKYRHDPEMIAEMYLATSEGYTDSPDLRVIWLHNLSEFYKERGAYEEAAQCKIHLGALVCEYLALLRPNEAIPIDKSAFKKAAPTVGGHLNLPHIDAEGGVCTINQFTRRGLFDELLEAVELLKKAERYETSIEVYKVLVAIHQKNRTYDQLIGCFADLQSLCDKIVDSNEMRSRLFSKYYRVGFYGAAFEKLDGKEFIYKESAAVRLADISNNLTEQFGRKFGRERIVLLPNKPVERETLDKDKLYIQIVETAEYLDPDELQTRVTPFERVFNINRFYFETPFVMEGKKMGNMEDQYKRKTVLTTELPFPCLRKRVPIIDKKEYILTPIETSIDLLNSRVQALHHEVSSASPNSKTLQIVLQGSVLPQVNAGPLEICRVFLSPENALKYPQPLVQKLQGIMREFITACDQALALNNNLIGAEQLAFQESLTQGFAELQQKIGQYMDLTQTSMEAPGVVS